jgi:hypothetical protein
MNCMPVRVGGGYAHFGEMDENGLCPYCGRRLGGGLDDLLFLLREREEEIVDSGESECMQLQCFHTNLP